MSDKTSIEWTDATWSPIAAFRRDNGKRGWHCEKVSEGCRGCYAEKLNARKLQVGTGLPYTRASRDLVEIRAVNLDVPLRWRKGRRIFVESMSDLFADFVPDELIDQVFAVMACAPQHTFQVLTKRPKRMLRYLSTPHIVDDLAAAMTSIDDAWPPLPGRWPIQNVWIGTSVEDQATADARIPLLLQTPAAVRFVSYEPALGPVDFADALKPICVRPRCKWHAEFQQEPLVLAGGFPHVLARGVGVPTLDWIIVGGESGPGARPFDVAWARSAIAQCRAAGVACFVKQLGASPVWYSETDPTWSGRGAAGEAIELRDRKGGDPSEWDPDLRVREFPAVRQ